MHIFRNHAFLLILLTPVQRPWVIREEPPLRLPPSLLCLASVLPHLLRPAVHTEDIRISTAVCHPSTIRVVIDLAIQMIAFGSHWIRSLFIFGLLCGYVLCLT